MAMRKRIEQGKLFTDECEGLPEDRLKCKINLSAFDQSSPEHIPERMEIVEALFGKKMKVWIEPQFYCCYGTNITIGIETGSVVIHDIPANTVVAGNPCRVIREIEEQDKKYYYKNRKITTNDLEEERSLR